MEAPSTQSGRSTNASQSPASHVGDVGSYRAQSAKRKRSTSNQDEESDDDDRKRPLSRQDPWDESRDSEPKPFACPYYKLDPLKYLNCFKRFTLKRVKDVKQHLNRKHSIIELYCPICWRTFGGPTQRDQHIVSRSCDPRDQPSADLGLMTPEQQNLITRRTDSGLDESKQWFGIWRILFPGAEVPKSPYLGTELQEMIGMVRTYWKENSRSIISNARQLRFGAGSTTINEFQTMTADEKDIHAFTAEVLTDTMNILLDQFDAETRDRGRECSNLPSLQEDASVQNQNSTSNEFLPNQGGINDSILGSEMDSIGPLDIDWAGEGADFPSDIIDPRDLDFATLD
ncbi:hypothetical protein CKAH01_18458 [Colletotrichum kahawae]|uniref:C2H2-type domain-containing protein n=1 Tax=Colletotrichum kahawae TaxID=34407 RepID=A0AAD9Y7S5_COLKA|nr:hypothetical protein CKAH01_18458 [Colletotrichum kahawae]